MVESLFKARKSTPDATVRPGAPGTHSATSVCLGELSFCSLIMQRTFLKPENVLGSFLVRACKFPCVEAHTKFQNSRAYMRPCFEKKKALKSGDWPDSPIKSSNENEKHISGSRGKISQ